MPSAADLLRQVRRRIGLILLRKRGNIGQVYRYGYLAQGVEMRQTAIILLIAAFVGMIEQVVAPPMALARYVNQGKESVHWDNWAQEHQDWVKKHPKKAEYYANHPDAAQRFINWWNRTHH